MLASTCLLLAVFGALLALVGVDGDARVGETRRIPFSSTTDIGISQEQFLRPSSTLDIESVLANAGVQVTKKRDDAELRV